MSRVSLDKMLSWFTEGSKDEHAEREAAKGKSPNFDPEKEGVVFADDPDDALNGFVKKK